MRVSEPVNRGARGPPKTRPGALPGLGPLRVCCIVLAREHRNLQLHPRPRPPQLRACSPGHSRTRALRACRAQGAVSRLSRVPSPAAGAARPGLSARSKPQPQACNRPRFRRGSGLMPAARARRRPQGRRWQMCAGDSGAGDRAYFCPGRVARAVCPPCCAPRSAAPGNTTTAAGLAGLHGGMAWVGWRKIQLGPHRGVHVSRHPGKLLQQRARAATHPPRLPTARIHVARRARSSQRRVCTAPCIVQTEFITFEASSARRWSGARGVSR